MRRILFVDDEPTVLEGLRGMLYSRRDRWEMTFADSGEAALRVMRDAAFDVIVADMRMPGMDGCALLRHVQQRHPEVVRLVLSGSPDMETALRAVPVAHQFMLKPCDPDLLENVVERACRLQAVIHDPAVRATVGGVQSLPTLPRLHFQLTEMLERDEVDMAAVARLIEQDPGMSAKVLQVINSALLGIGRDVRNIQEAVGLLGTRMIRTLALAAHVFTLGGVAAHHELRLHRLQRHSLLTGSIARQIAIEDHELSEDAFVAGLLHDVGKLVLMMRRPEVFDAVDTMSRTERRPQHEIERGLLGVSHAEIGGFLLGMWGLPYPVTESVANHHAPERVPQRGGLDVLAAVYVANVLAHEQEARLGMDDTVHDPLNESYLESLSLTSRVPEWRDMAEAQVDDGLAESWLDDTDSLLS